MSTADRAITRSIEIDAPVARVFDLMSSVEGLARWMPVTEFEPRVGGSFALGTGAWVAVGTVTEFEPPSSLSFTWNWRDQPLPEPTVVRLTVEETASGCRVQVHHSGFAAHEQADLHGRGWQYYLARLHTSAMGGDPGLDEFEAPGVS